MRVAFVVPCLRRPSGWTTAATGTIAALVQYKDVDPYIVVSSADEPHARQQFPGSKLLVVRGIQGMALSRPLSWPTMAATSSHVSWGGLPQIDIVHSLDGYPTGLVGHWIAQRARVPHVLTALGTYSVIWHRRWLDASMYRRVLRRASAICPMSEGTRNLVAYHFGREVADKLTTVHLGTDYCTQVPRRWAESRPQPERPTLLSVGAIKERKGQLHCLMAFAKLKLRFPTAQYWIVGRPDDLAYQAELVSYIRTNQVRDVSLLGELEPEPLRECFRRASVFVLAPQAVREQFEGFGLVFLEAGAYGLPVVATASGGVPDAVRDKVTGFLVAPNDVDALAHALAAIVEAPTLALRMGMENRRWSETFSWVRFAEQQGAVYESVLTQPVGPTCTSAGSNDGIALQ